MRVHFPGGRNSSFYIIDDSSSGVCLFVWEWQWQWWWWLGLSSWCACEVLFFSACERGLFAARGVARRRFCCKGSRFGRIACLLPLPFLRGFVAVSKTEIITAKGVWMPKVRFVPVILEDRVEDQSVITM